MTTRTTAPEMQHGFTLVEMVVVIAITGVVAAMVGVFIRGPVQAYVDTARRAQLTESADTALRRFARDVRSALPNSVRVTGSGNVTYLEFIPTVGGGRYRSYPYADGSGNLTQGNVLDFDNVDGAFDVLGPVPVYAAGDSITVFNMGPGSVADAYVGNNRAQLTNANANADLFSTDIAPFVVQFNPARQFPSPSPSYRFHVVGQPVTYECNPDTGLLRRYTGYGFQAAQPAPPSTTPVVLVSGVGETCAIAYDPEVTKTRTGLVTIYLTLTDSGETVRLVQQVHVQNMP